MDVRTLRALEWDRVLALLSLCADTAEGKEHAGTLLPETDAAAVRIRHARVAECAAGESLCGRLSLQGYGRTPTAVPDGFAFPLETLRQVRGGLRVWRAAQEWLADEAAPKPALSASLPSSEPLRGLCALMERLLDEHGEVADGASDRLRAIRRERERARSRVRSHMESLVESLGTPVLREATYTVRNGRFVLPVHASRKSQVKGILHDTSSTGGTAFIEPLEVVDLNNRLTDLDAEEREEIQRILVQVSADVTAASEPLNAAWAGLEALDVDLACARLGRACKGILPLLNEGDELALLGARHPLLDPSLGGLRREAWGESHGGEVVPLDLSLHLKDLRTLVISGPNAGGKSVAIKTVGLLCAMHQAGIPIPAREGTSLPVFPYFHATVGDSQSILDSLSTFSARMTALKDALEHLREPFLIVLDELGSGTDPSEGAALGEAILLHLHARRGYTICSTHYESVKARALVTEGMVNAGMEFEEATLRPTYRLRVGQVGASRALEIAERVGLAAPILAEARALLPEGEKHLKEILKALEEEISAHERQEAGLEALRKSLEEARNELARARQDAESERERFLKGVPEALRAVEAHFLKDLKSEAERQAARRSVRKVAQQVFEEVRATLQVPESAGRPGPMPAVGDRVKVAGFGVTGTVSAVDGGTGRLVLDCDGKTLSVGTSDVEVLDGPPPPPSRGSRGISVESGDASWELNLIGQTVAEAEAALEPFVERAAMAGLGHVRIIHGIGTGRLKSFVRDWARRSALVATWEEAPPSGGGTGVTLLSLKE